ncbi:hypothetical protein PRZ48_008896 [Zasmidium cellare]|uniref:Uncharacterized protein n=1 Tax=Zasmidium cellare TaxID=395010 RepID=A0ABR0EGS0_ZASCE|nr:hypothetical protein PRZ48_008896 [Zasmidium cellare]
MTTRPRNPQACLLGLPAELRNRIFLEVAMSASVKPNGELDPVNIANPDAVQKSLFRSFYLNKQLFHELKTLFYGNNLFTFTTKEVCVAKKVRPLQKTKDQAIWFADLLLAQRTLAQLCAAFSDDSHVAYNMDNFGNFLEMKLVHTAARPGLRHIRLDTLVPLGLPGERVFYEDIFGGHANDWLYPVRSLQTIGFGNLKSLEVFVSYNSARLPLHLEFPKYFVITHEEIQKWVNKEVAGIQMDGVQVNVRYWRFSRGV